jgi:hypothetical protein
MRTQLAAAAIVRVLWPARRRAVRVKTVRVFTDSLSAAA